jgi:hypothetical protein
LNQNDNSFGISKVTISGGFVIIVKVYIESVKFYTSFRKSTILLQVHVVQGENANNHARSYQICIHLFVERAEQEESIQFKELQDHIKQLREAYEAQGEAYQQLYLQHEDSVKVQFVKAASYLQQLLNYWKLQSIWHTTFVYEGLMNVRSLEKKLKTYGV